MVSIWKWVFLGPKIGISAWKSVFCYRTRFRQWPVCSPRQDGQFGFFGSIFRFWITTVFAKKIGWRGKKSSPTPLWGHRLPETALAPSARRPSVPCTACGLENCIRLKDTLLERPKATKDKVKRAEGPPAKGRWKKRFSGFCPLRGYPLKRFWQRP